MRKNRGWWRVVDAKGGCGGVSRWGCLALLLCAGVAPVQGQVLQAEYHVLSCTVQGNMNEYASYVLGLNTGAGMQTVGTLTSPDDGTTMILSDGTPEDSATLDCRVGCIQSAGDGYCFPLDAPQPVVLQFAVRCAAGAYAGQTWGLSFAMASDNDRCKATVVDGVATGWVCAGESNGGDPLPGISFDCDAGCSQTGACACTGAKCPQTTPRSPRSD